MQLAKLFKSTKNKLKNIETIFDNSFMKLYLFSSILLVVAPMLGLILDNKLTLYFIIFPVLLFGILLSLILSKKRILSILSKIVLNKDELEFVSFINFNYKEIESMQIESSILNKIVEKEDSIESILECLKSIEDYNYEKIMYVINLLYKKDKECISLQKICLGNQDQFNPVEIFIHSLLAEEIKSIILNDKQIISKYFNLEYILKNNQIFNEENIKYIYYPLLKKEIKFHYLVKLMFEKSNSSFSDSLHLELFNFFNSDSVENIFYLKKLIIEDILETKSEKLIINYKEEFLSYVENIKFENMNNLYIIKQKLLNKEKNIKLANKIINI